jgi:mRNA interferase RelE/StbE
MSRYRVEVTRSAEKELQRLPLKVVHKIVEVLQSLEEDPRPAGCKKLKGYKDLWRVRVGNYRIVYAVDDVILLVDVREIGHRKDVYDTL